MTQRTAIEWTDYSSNPIKAVNVATGKRGWFCTKVSPGCANCYAAALNKRWGNGLDFVPENEDRVEWVLDEAELKRLLRLPAETDGHRTRVFICDMTDLFHEGISAGLIASVFAVMAVRPDVTFQVLTKRPERMRAILSGKAWIGEIYWQAAKIADRYVDPVIGTWPLPNVWLGVSAENQRMLDQRVPLLLDTPATVRFVSCEPLLGPLDLGRVVCKDWRRGLTLGNYLDWVICGGESGPGRADRKLVKRCDHARHSNYTRGEIYPHSRHCNGWRPKPESLHWVRSIRDQCVDAGVAFHFKQFGGPTPKSGGRILDGRTWDAAPSPEGARS